MNETFARFVEEAERFLAEGDRSIERANALEKVFALTVEPAFAELPPALLDLQLALARYAPGDVAAMITFADLERAVKFARAFLQTAP